MVLSYLELEHIWRYTTQNLSFKKTKLFCFADSFFTQKEVKLTFLAGRGRRFGRRELLVPRLVLRQLYGGGAAVKQSEKNLEGLSGPRREK